MIFEHCICLFEKNYLIIIIYINNNKRIHYLRIQVEDSDQPVHPPPRLIRVVAVQTEEP